MKKRAKQAGRGGFVNMGAHRKIFFWSAGICFRFWRQDSCRRQVGERRGKPAASCCGIIHANARCAPQSRFFGCLAVRDENQAFFSEAGEAVGGEAKGPENLDELGEFFRGRKVLKALGNAGNKDNIETLKALEHRGAHILVTETGHTHLHRVSAEVQHAVVAAHLVIETLVRALPKLRAANRHGFLVDEKLAKSPDNLNELGVGENDGRGRDGVGNSGCWNGDDRPRRHRRHSRGRGRSEDSQGYRGQHCGGREANGGVGG